MKSCQFYQKVSIVSCLLEFILRLDMKIVIVLIKLDME
jgi:hypothetical protein